MPYEVYMLDGNSFPVEFNHRNKPTNAEIDKKL